MASLSPDVTKACPMYDTPPAMRKFFWCEAATSPAPSKQAGLKTTDSSSVLLAGCAFQIVMNLVMDLVMDILMDWCRA